MTFDEICEADGKVKCLYETAKLYRGNRGEEEYVRIYKPQIKNMVGYGRLINSITDPPELSSHQAYETVCTAIHDALTGKEGR